MALEIEKLLDDTGWRLLLALQQNARLSYSELGLRVGLSSPAVAERIHRMEDAGIISGYHAEVNVARSASLSLLLFAWVLHLEKGVRALYLTYKKCLKCWSAIV